MIDAKYTKIALDLQTYAEIFVSLPFFIFQMFYLLFQNRSFVSICFVPSFIFVVKFKILF